MFLVAPKPTKYCSFMNDFLRWTPLGIGRRLNSCAAGVRSAARNADLRPAGTGVARHLSRALKARPLAGSSGRVSWVRTALRRCLMDPMDPMGPMDPLDPMEPMDPMDPFGMQGQAGAGARCRSSPLFASMTPRGVIDRPFQRLHLEKYCSFMNDFLRWTPLGGREGRLNSCAAGVRSAARKVDLRPAGTGVARHLSAQPPTSPYAFPM